MGRVYRAEQAMLGRTVAVKVIHPHLLGDDQTVARFYNEARAASRLNHPNSVGVIDFGRTDDGILYLVMEFITGKDLAMTMYEEGPLPFQRVVEILLGVLDALGEAHALGVVHRDLKPENIILRRFRSGQDLVKVVDFGLATIVGGGDTSITRPGLVCGTPDYMSPEQGRGEQVDGRGDLYSLGVVLFELLAEELPFQDETPTKVVLRHLTDPAPDPRQVAPHREIPDVLAEIVLKSLSKSPEQRHQTAQEMADALRDAAATLVQKRRRRDTATCAACGSSNPASSRFCGTCGARLTGRIEVPPSFRPTPRSSFIPAAESHRPLLHREAEIERVDALRREATGRSVRVQLRGDAGMGKTRLLEELAQRYQQEGDLVEWAGPHPSGAPVPYHAVRSLMASLFGVEDLGAVPPEALEDPLARAGISEVLEPTGLRGFPGRSRTGAVAVALATAVRAALGRGQGARAVLVVDDLHRCDGLTQQTLRSLPDYLLDDSVLVMTAGVPHGGNGVDANVVHLGGIPWERATEFFDGRAQGASLRPSLPAAPPSRLAPPLYLEQLQALHALGGGDDAGSVRLADVVLQRMDRLDLNARRLLQTAAVLGQRAPLELLRELAEGADLGGLEVLQSQELVRLHSTEVEILHPFIRDLVEAAIPAEARKSLHQRALGLRSDRDAPLEVRAEHGYRAGEPMSALMLLERMGDVARQRGDGVASVLAFRRGLDLARRELLESGDIVMDRAIVTFSRKLGEALDSTGDVMGADGVLREAIDLTGPASQERAQMLLALGRVAVRRGRKRDAARQLGQALELVTGEGSAGLEGQIQLALADVRRSEGDMDAALTAYRRAVEEVAGAEADQQARASLALAEALLDTGDATGAGLCLAGAQTLAQEAEAPALEAAVLGMMGRTEQAKGSLERASAHFESAAEQAALAGDAEAHTGWRRATLGRT